MIRPEPQNCPVTFALAAGIKLDAMAAGISSQLRFSRWHRMVLPFILAVFTLAVLIYCGLRIYTIKLAHRSIDLLEEASQIPIGAEEDSILPLVARYGGSRWTPPSLGRSDDCVDKSACEEEKARTPEYQYGIALAPFDVISSPKKQAGWIRHFLIALMIRIPSEWRDPISLRDWMVDVEISIRARRVVAVHSDLFVEGRSRWLGSTWSLSADEPTLHRRSAPYAIDGTFLTFPGHGGAGTVQYLSPAATAEQFKAAQSFNHRCITGLLPCHCLADLTPVVFEYMSRHPEAGSSVQTDGCPYRLNAP